MDLSVGGDLASTLSNDSCRLMSWKEGTVAVALLMDMKSFIF
jgi:hypothetical protein